MIHTLIAIGLILGLVLVLGGMFLWIMGYPYSRRIFLTGAAIGFVSTIVYFVSGGAQ